MTTPSFLNKCNARFVTTGQSKVGFKEFQKAREQKDSDQVPMDLRGAAADVNFLERKMDVLAHDESWMLNKTENPDGSVRVEQHSLPSFYNTFGGTMVLSNGEHVQSTTSYVSSRSARSEMTIDPQGEPSALTMVENSSTGNEYFTNSWSHNYEYQRHDEVEQYDTWSTGSGKARSVLVDNGNQTVTILNFDLKSE